MNGARLGAVVGMVLVEGNELWLSMGHSLGLTLGMTVVMALGKLEDG